MEGFLSGAFTFKRGKKSNMINDFVKHSRWILRLKITVVMFDDK